MQAGPGQCATRVEGSESCIAAAGGILEYGSPRFGSAASVSCAKQVSQRIEDQGSGGTVPFRRAASETVQEGELARGTQLEHRSKIVCAASVCDAVEVARRVLDQTTNGIGSVRTTHEGVQHGLEAAVEIQCVDGSVSVRAAAAVVPQMLPLLRRGVANGVPPSAPPSNV